MYILQIEDTPNHIVKISNLKKKTPIHPDKISEEIFLNS
jgi:hypothetical protein